MNSYCCVLYWMLVAFSKIKKKNRTQNKNSFSIFRLHWPRTIEFLSEFPNLCHSIRKKSNSKCHWTLNILVQCILFNERTENKTKKERKRKRKRKNTGINITVACFKIQAKGKWQNCAVDNFVKWIFSHFNNDFCFVQCSVDVLCIIIWTCISVITLILLIHLSDPWLANIHPSIFFFTLVE